MKVRESVQLQTVLAMYDKEIDRDRAVPRSDDQDAQLQSPGMKFLRRGYQSKVTKGRTSAWTGEWENVVSGKQMDSVQEEALAVFASEVIVDDEHNHPLLLQRRRHRLTEESLRKAVAPGEKFLCTERSESYPKGHCTHPSCNFWHPVCQSHE